MYKTVRDHLEAFTGESHDIDYSRLYNKFASVVKSNEASDIEKEFAYRSAREVHERQIDVMRKVVAQELAKEVERVNGSLPVASVFEALQVAKRASATHAKDVGLSSFLGYLEAKWKRNRDASILAADYLQMQEHFGNNFPKSIVGAVIEEIGEKGYADLPMTDMMEIASRIGSQEDFDYEITQACLGGNSPHAKKARRFILALVNSPSTHAEEAILGEFQEASPEEIGEGVEKGFGEETYDFSNLSPDEIIGLIAELEEKLQLAQANDEPEVMQMVGSVLRRLQRVIAAKYGKKVSQVVEYDIAPRGQNDPRQSQLETAIYYKAVSVMGQEAADVIRRQRNVSVEDKLQQYKDAIKNYAQQQQPADPSQQQPVVTEEDPWAAMQNAQNPGAVQPVDPTQQAVDPNQQAVMPEEEEDPWLAMQNAQNPGAVQASIRACLNYGKVRR